VVITVLIVRCISPVDARECVGHLPCHRMGDCQRQEQHSEIFTDSLARDCHGYTQVLSIPNLWIFPPTDWISYSTDISMGVAAQSSPPSIFVSSLPFSIRKYVLEIFRLGEFCCNKIYCNILHEL